jgi:hypothetical protein
VRGDLRRHAEPHRLAHGSDHPRPGSDDVSGQQRLAMVADLLERAAVLVRRGDTFPVFGHAHSAVGRMMGGHPAEAEYRAILAMLDLAPADIDAAVAAILRGEPPPDSLVAAHAEVERLRALAREGWAHAREVADSEGVEPAERIAEALREIDDLVAPVAQLTPAQARADYMRAETHARALESNVLDSETCPRCGQFSCTPECIAAEQVEVDAYDGPTPRKHA